MPYHTSMGRTSYTGTWNQRTSWQNRAEAVRWNWKSVTLEWPSSWTRRLATYITPGTGPGPPSTWPQKFWEVEGRGTHFPLIYGHLGPWWHSWRGENQTNFPKSNYSDKKDYHKITFHVLCETGMGGTSTHHGLLSTRGERVTGYFWRWVSTAPILNNSLTTWWIRELAGDLQPWLFTMSRWGMGEFLSLGALCSDIN